MVSSLIPKYYWTCNDVKRCQSLEGFSCPQIQIFTQSRIRCGSNCSIIIRLASKRKHNNPKPALLKILAPWDTWYNKDFFLFNPDLIFFCYSSKWKNLAIIRSSYIYLTLFSILLILAITLSLPSPLPFSPFFKLFG